VRTGSRRPRSGPAAATSYHDVAAAVAFGSLTRRQSHDGGMILGFGLDGDDCHLGVGIEMFLASISSRDRQRISQALYTCIARCETIHEVFETCTDGKTKMVVMKGRSVGDVLFICIVTEIDEGRATAKLQNLCLAAS